jgi:hypothetical protein
MRKTLLAAFATLSLMAVGIPTTPASAAGGLEGVPSFSKVFVIVGENTSLSQLDRKSAPYQLGWVKPHSAWLTDYWGLSHWSTSDYIGMTSGQFLECHQLDLKPAVCNQNIPNLFSQLDDAGVSWLSWNESMPEPCYLLDAGSSNDANSYRVKHNPALYYQSVVGPDFSGSTGNAFCRAHDISMGTTARNDTSTFNAALASGAVARFNYIVPNQCEDGHDNCKPQGNPIRQFDDFLAREIPKIMASPAWDANSAIFVVYDEGQDGGPGKAKNHAGGNTPFAVIGGQIHEAQYAEFANHYSLLRTWEDGFGIGTYLGGADTANPIDQIWT